MEYLFIAIVILGHVVRGLFVSPVPPYPVVETPSVESEIGTSTETASVPETSVVKTSEKNPAPTKTPERSPVVQPIASTSVTVPIASGTAPVLPPIPAKKGGGSPATSGTLTLELPNLKNVSEKDILIFKALVRTSDGISKDVTQEALWKVLGPVGGVSKGVFTATLSSDMAEFGRAPGAVVATYTDLLTGKELVAESPIFEVKAFVPKGIETKGQ